MREIQNVLLKYAENSPIFSKVLQADIIISLIYPIYLVLDKIRWLNPICRYIAYISAVLHIAYLIGTILCFAENKIKYLVVAYGCMTLNYLLSLQYGFRFNLLIYLIFYGLITWVCIKGLQNDPQWQMMKTQISDSTLEKVSVDVEAAEGSICPNCGSKIDKRMKFCKECGSPVNQ